MQVIYSYLYQFTTEATHFDILSYILNSLFYQKDHNNLHFYMLPPTHSNYRFQVDFSLFSIFSLHKILSIGLLLGY